MNSREIKDWLRMDPAVMAELEITAPQMANMSLRSFFDLATTKGFDVSVSTKRSLDGHGFLSIRIVDEDPHPIGKGGS